METPFFSGKTACCFTGHRPQGLPDGGNARGPGMRQLAARLDAAVAAAVGAGVTTFYAGGAAGFDALAGEAVLREIERGAAIRLVLALPSRRYLATRNYRDYGPLLRLTDAADEIYYASEADNGRDALLARNRYMVEHADCCVAYLTENYGGTAYTVRYAQSCGVPVYNIASIAKI